MQGRFDFNPICELGRILYIEFKHYKQFGYNLPHECGYNEIDPIIKLILLNNGCKISSDSKQFQLVKDIIDDEYKLYFITGMIGNDANEYYDFVTFNGTKILIVFIDYFNFITDEFEDKDNPLYELKKSMGNSVYYDAIKKIVEVFYLTLEPMSGGLLTTAMATTQRWNQAIIAIKILNIFKPIDENDVCDMPKTDIENILNGNFNIKLCGIRTYVN